MVKQMSNDMGTKLRELFIKTHPALIGIPLGIIASIGIRLASGFPIF